MRLTVVGCSGSIPSRHSPASCYLLEADGFRLDMGSGALGALQRYAGLAEVDAVALSHLHADHFIDMCSFWVARTYDGLVELAIDPPAYTPRQATTLFLKAKVSSLTLSLVDPDGFISAVEG